MILIFMAILSIKGSGELQKYANSPECLSLAYTTYCVDVAKTYSNLKVVGDPCQKITLLLLKSKRVRVIVPESCF